MNDVLDRLVPCKTREFVNRIVLSYLVCPLYRLRDIAHHTALKYVSVSDWSSYRALRNKVISML